MNIYRKIYEQHYGPIPKDSSGRSYEIHHIDGNHQNNDITNLQLVTIEEHFKIHYQQGDWGACHIISTRMNISSEEQSHLASLANKNRLAMGNHPFIGDQHPMKVRAKNGTHHFIGGEVARKLTQRKLADGTHSFLKQNRTDPNQIIITCPHCGESGGSPKMKQYHFDKCTVNSSQKLAWYNNGDISRQYIWPPNSSWKKGRLVQSSVNRHNLGKKYYTDGTVNKFCVDHPGPGWRLGMIKSSLRR